MGFWLLVMDILRLGELQIDRLPKEVAIHGSPSTGIEEGYVNGK